MSRKKKKKKYYGVVKGRRPGIYTEWYGPDGAEAQITEFPGAAYRGFQSLEEAEKWFRSADEGQSAETSEPSDTERVSNTAETEHSAALAGGKVVIYTDGACLGNPGPGGYGVVLLSGKRRRELSQGFRRTTNNRMELMACIAGLRALKRKSSVVLYSDSRYVVNGMTKGWARRWRANDWKRNKTDKAENTDLWSQLLDLCDRHEVEFLWVKGHAGNQENERCDELSMQAASGKDLPTDPGFDSPQT